MLYTLSPPPTPWPTFSLLMKGSCKVSLFTPRPNHLQRYFSLLREIYPIPQGFQLFGQPWELQIFLTWLPVRDPLPCLLLPMMPLPRYQIRMMKMLIMLMNMMMMTLMMTMMMTMIMTMTMTFHPPTMAFPRSRRRFLQSYLPILRLSPSFF